MAAELHAAAIAAQRRSRWPGGWLHKQNFARLIEAQEWSRKPAARVRLRRARQAVPVPTLCWRTGVPNQNYDS